MDYQQLTENLKQYGQEHLVNFWPDLNESERQQLYNDIKACVYFSL